MTKKSLGQHWLDDDGILTAIVDAASVSQADYVLEVGPGKGTLTRHIARRAQHVMALEFDQDLIPHLQRTFAAEAQNVSIREGDIRTFDFTQLPQDYKVVANIPYYLTSHLVRSLSESENPPSVAALLIQKEVAERICAQPGQMSILAVAAQLHFECTLDIEVPAQYFTPPPKVDSQVVVLTRRREQLFEVDEPEFFRLVKAGFSEKRKKLTNALSSSLGLQKSEAESLLDVAGLPRHARAQELSMRDWFEVYCAYGIRST